MHYLLIICLLCILTRKTFSIVVVNGNSMAGELCHGDKLLFIRWPFSHFLCKGMIVISKSPQNRKELTVKRITGLPGHTIICAETQTHRVLPPGHCFLEGDNTSVSVDSKVWGPIPLRYVKGVMVFKIR